MSFSSSLQTAWRFCCCSTSNSVVYDPALNVPNHNLNDELKASQVASLGAAHGGSDQGSVPKEATSSSHTDSKTVSAVDEIKFADIVGAVDEQLALLVVPCNLLTANLSISFDQLSKWSELMSEHDDLLYARQVIPTLVLFLRSTYSVDFSEWLLVIARDRQPSDYNNDRRFLTLQVLHKCIPSNHRPSVKYPGYSPSGYYCLVVSTMSTLLSLSSLLSLQQTLIDSIAIDLAHFESALGRLRLELPSTVCRIHERLMKELEWKSLLEKAHVSAEAKKEVHRIIDQLTIRRNRQLDI